MPSRVVQLIVTLLAVLACRVEADTTPKHRLETTAFRILPSTSNREAAFASVCVGLNDRVYLGPAFYGKDAYLVELDPSDGAQRVVVDTHALCGLSATGFAAQAKIHTRLFVAPSGTLYFGSKQGYPAKGESTTRYLGGYVMSYNPATDEGRNLGKVPFRGHGVYDVVADESRGLIYLTTCADELGDYFWYKLDMKSGHFEGLGPRVMTNAHPLLDPQGRCYTFTHDGQLACYDPDTNDLTLRPLMTGPEEQLVPDSIYQAEITADGKTVYMIPWKKPVIYSVDLLSTNEQIRMETRCTFADVDQVGTMDPCFGPDGKLYLISGWKTAEAPRGALHLVSYDPRTDSAADQGTLTIRNRDEFVAALGPDKEVGKPPYHGVRAYDDGTLYPHSTQGLAIGRDGTVYVMIINPLAILRVEGFKASRPDTASTPADPLETAVPAVTTGRNGWLHTKTDT